MKISIPRGTYDVLPEQAGKWHYVEITAREMARRYHFQEVRTPIFEYTELFQRGVGETTDIVEKEMYTFNDRKGRSLTLRPEGTASVVRSFVENKVYALEKLTKWYYLGPMFRYERPQSGRMRQFTQFGVEAFGSKSPSLDAEVMIFAYDLLRQLGLRKFYLELNSVGCPVCRPGYREALLTYLQGVREALCPDCQSRMERNPLRVLDCKNEACLHVRKEAPSILTYLCEDCAVHFQTVQSFLDELEISYVVNPRLVRGLDYYTQTTFELISSGTGAAGTLAAGGRYNGLVSQLDGPEDVPGIGFATGLERLLAAMEEEQVEVPREKTLDCYLITHGEEAQRRGFRILHELRLEGVSCEQDYMGRKLKAQLKAADREGATYVLILGEDERKRQTIQLREMESGRQEEIPLNELIQVLKQRL